MRRTIPGLGLTLGLSLAVLLACQRNAPPKPTLLPTEPSLGQELGLSPSPTPSQTKTATPAPSATPSPTPPRTPTATVTPTPTATPVPSQRLAAAQQAFAWGEYDRATQAFVTLLADPAVDVDERQLAAYWAGRSAVEAGDYSRALEFLEDFLKNYPTDARVTWVHLLRARAYEAIGDHQGAINAYQAYLDTGDNTLAVYAFQGIGNAAMLALDYQRAAQAYTDGLRVAPDNGWVAQLREGIAKSQLAQDNPQAAIRQYDAILQIARISAYRARILHLAGQALLAAGDVEGAHQRYLQAVTRYPEALDSYLALIELVDAGVPVNEYQRGLVDYYAQAYQPAIEAFTRYIKDKPQSPGADTLWYLALSLKANGNLSSAIERFQQLIKTYPQSKHLAEAWLEMAEAHAWRDDTPRAIETYREFVKQNPTSPSAATALWRAAELEAEDGRWTKAAASYRDLAARYPADENAPQALFEAALLEYRRAEFGAARDGWQALLEDYPDSLSALATRFWLGKALLALNDQDEAVSTLKVVVKSSASSYYYGLRAAEIIASSSVFTDGTSTASPPAASIAGNQAEAETWLASWLPITGTITLDSPGSAIAGSSAFRRGDELLAVGLRSDALDEFEAVKDAWWDDPLAMAQLAQAFSQRGLYRLSILCAERLIWLSPATSRDDAPLFIRQLSYPVYYRDLVVPEARSQAIPPLLLFALIRQESLFEPSITSFADARGLSQIIPATGEWIAGRLGDSDFQTNDLWLPYVNIRYGAWYLGVQLATFDAQAVPALVAYNAGPGRVHQWMNDASGDIDLFVETIPFAESRRYIRIIYENYAYYRQLYPGLP
jgi:soluble lytic murein transglycosylase